MNRIWSMIGTLVLLLAFVASAGATGTDPSNVIDQPTRKLNDEPANAEPATPLPRFTNELDEVIGDTITVGYTYRDMQHNATLSRMIAAHPTGDDQTKIYFTWTYREEPNSTSIAHFREAIRSADGTLELFPADGSAAVNAGGGNFSAYNLINVDEENEEEIITYHGGPASGDEYHSYHSYPNQFIPYFWNAWEVPETDVTSMWPHADMGMYDGNYYVHGITNDYSDPDNLFEDYIYYFRTQWDPVTFTLENATPGGVNQIPITEHAINLSNSLAVGRDGSHVAVANTVYRNTAIGEVPPGTDTDTQFNNDVYYWESTDGGETFDFSLDAAVNVTNFIGPDADLLPDTLAANRDTMRCHTWIDMHYDPENRLHVSFTTNDFYYYTNSAFRMNRLWYWNSEDQNYIQIADGTQQIVTTGTVTTAWEEYADNSQLYFDEDTGVLWCAFVQYGLPGDTLADGEPYDVSDGNSQGGFWMKATDVFVTASPDGHRWAKPVNVTKTINYDGNMLLPYETVSEREMTLAENNTGDYLNILYTRDFDPGVAVPGGDAPEGDPTWNEVMYHAVPKQALIDSFDVNAEWVRNYPMHIDSTGFWEPDDDYAYSDDGFMSYVGVSAKETNPLTPDQFELQQNYPNPFNPSTTIDFSLQAPGKVKLAVYDVLGREVATLVNRGMSAGNHTVSFYAGDLASGVYFYKLTSGDVSQVRKMVLMK